MRLLSFMALLCSLCWMCSTEKKIKKSFGYGEYQKVIDFYKNALAKNPADGKTNYYMAESYRLSNRIRESEPYYAAAQQLSGSVADTARFYYAKSLMANGKNDEAMETFKALEKSTSNRKLKTIIQAEIKSLSGVNALTQLKSTFYKVKNLEALNTAFVEYAPVFANGELYFTSNRANKKIYEATGTPFSDLYRVLSKGAVVDISTLQPMPPIFNDENVNEGCATFSADGKIMIFAKGNTGKRRGSGDVDLFMSRLDGNAWTKPQPINVNLPNSWESTPCLSPDGKTLIFSSNRPGSRGGLDLYSATMDGNGRFSNIRNMGPTINTVDNELFPCVADNGKLYFSSDGHPGFGMLDIFEVTRVKGKTTVQNLGKPMNSEADDFGIFFYRPDRGFFSSNRPGGAGDDDIYTFVNEDPNIKTVNYTLEGKTVALAADNTQEPLGNVRMSLLDQNGKLMERTKTPISGTFKFKVFENENYTLLAEADGYLVKRQPFTTIGKSIPRDSLKELTTNVVLDTIVMLDRIEKNKIFVLKNIYFDFDKANIRPDAAVELDKLASLLNDNPQIKIEMGSHTDSIGSNSYNLTLSQNRADSTVAYLIKKGIAPNRLTSRGYGEEVPIARNTNPDGTDNPEGRQQNRRTEFKIIEVGKAPVSSVVDENVKVDTSLGDDDIVPPPPANPTTEEEEDKFFKEELNKKKGDE